MKNEKKRTFIDNHPILALIIGVLLLGFLGKCCNSDVEFLGSQFPMDDQASENLYLQEEYLEGKAELDQLKSDPCAYDIYLGVPPEYQRCGTNRNDNSIWDKMNIEPELPDASECYCSGNTLDCNDLGHSAKPKSVMKNVFSLLVGIFTGWMMMAMAEHAN